MEIKEYNEQNNNEILKIENLSVSFTQYTRGTERQTLSPIERLNVSVYRGELTAVVGESGSGKSLLAHAVLGILPYNSVVSGNIYYCGRELDECYLKKLRGKEIVLIPQGVSYLDPLMRAGEQIRKGKNDADSKKKCTELLKQYGLSEQTEKLYPFELSGGMARRIFIASALMEDPKLVIADEPTPGLDEKTAVRVMGHLKEIADGGAGVLVITHDLELALKTADRILIFYEGKIVEEVTPKQFQKEESLSHPYTKALYRAMPEHGMR